MIGTVTKIQTKLLEGFSQLAHFPSPFRFPRSSETSFTREKSGGNDVFPRRFPTFRLNLSAGYRRVSKNKVSAELYASRTLPVSFAVVFVMQLKIHS